MAKILIVEDDVQLNDIFAIILNKEGYKIERAKDGDEALRKAKSFRPDLILLDILMPKMNGLEFLQKYDLKKKNKGVKVIVFSNISMPNEMEAAKELGAARYLIKASTSPKELANLISKLLKDK